MPAGTPVSNDLFSQALQQALQASNMSSLQVNLPFFRAPSAEPFSVVNSVELCCCSWMETEWHLQNMLNFTCIITKILKCFVGACSSHTLP